MKHTLWIALITLSLFGCAAHQPTDTVTVYLIRHAETVARTVNPDRPLNATGQRRAQWLAEYFLDREIRHLYSTNITRTLQTIAPVMQQKSLSVEHYNPRELETFADQLRALTQPALVAGHSNTTPALLNALMRESQHKQIDDAEHRLIFVVQMKDGEVQAVEIQHSEP